MRGPGILQRSGGPAEPSPPGDNAAMGNHRPGRTGDPNPNEHTHGHTDGDADSNGYFDTESDGDRYAQPDSAPAHGNTDPGADGAPGDRDPDGNAASGERQLFPGLPGLLHPASAARPGLQRHSPRPVYGVAAGPAPVRR